LLKSGCVVFAAEKEAVLPKTFAAERDALGDPVGALRVTPTEVADREAEVLPEIVTVGTVRDTVLPALVCTEAFETLTVRLGGGVLDTPTPVADSPCDVEADTATVGRVTLILLAVLVCNEAFDTLTVRDGGGVRVEATAVADRACDDEAAIGGIVTPTVATPEVCS